MPGRIRDAGRRGSAPAATADQPPAGQHGRHIGLVPIHSRGRCPHSRPVSQVRKPAIVSQCDGTVRCRHRKIRVYCYRRDGESGRSAAMTMPAGMTTRRLAFITDNKTATRSDPLQYPAKTARNVSNGPPITLTGAPSESVGSEKSTGPSAHRETNSSITTAGTTAACSPNRTISRTPGVYRIFLAVRPKSKYANR